MNPDKRFRKATKQERIVTALRREIIQGACPLASQLPSHLVLARRFRVSPVTIQRAMDCLAEEGFIRTKQRHGMFVVERPPHLSHYALVFAEDPANARLWSRFYATLLNESEVIQHEDACCILPFYGINGHTDSKDYQRLLGLVLADRLAGLIFVQGEHYVANTPLMTHRRMPRVAIKSRPLFPHVPVVTTDIRAFMQKALDHFAERGRRRVALVAGYPKPEILKDTRAYFLEELAARDLETRDSWYLPSSPESAIAARYWVQLLMQQPAADRPDALLVADDNFIEETAAGLSAGRVTKPEDLAVVAQCSFPWAGARPALFQRLGFDAYQVLRMCLEMIIRQRRNETVPPQTMLEPMFEEELAGRMPSAECRPVRRSLGEGGMPNLKSSLVQ